MDDGPLLWNILYNEVNQTAPFLNVCMSFSICFSWEMNVPKGPSVEGWSQPRALQGNSRTFRTRELLKVRLFGGVSSKEIVGPDHLLLSFALVSWLLWGKHHPLPNTPTLMYVLTIDPKTTVPELLGQNLQNQKPRQAFPFLFEIAYRRQRRKHATHTSSF